MFTELGIVDGFVLFLFPAAMAFVAASDLFTMRISNLVSVILIAAFAILAPFVGFDLSLAGHHLAAGATVLAIGFACFSFGWVGGGDAKIAAATALWFGWLHTLEYLLIAALLGGVLTLALVVFRNIPLPASVSGVDWVQRLYKASNGVPYGIALAASALIVYPATVWMTAIAH